MNKRVYGVIGIKSRMSNWNADFNGYPKSISSGEFFGSDKALKYTMKKMWEENGEKVMYIKSYKMDEKEGKLRPKSLKERYEELYSELKNDKDGKKIIENLFSATDIKNFGATFAEEKNNISITGAVQITQGFNKYDGMSVEEQHILSPFRSENKTQKKEGKEADSSTIGTKIVANEAHYYYTVIINPHQYDNYVEMGVTEGYTNDDYEKFKNVAICSATAFNTNAKAGCENEFTMFIETENDLYLPDLSNYIIFEKGEEKDNIHFKFSDLLSRVKDRIHNIKIYYNPYILNKPILAGDLDVTYINIFSEEVI